MIIKKEDIKSIEFVMENCETVIIPIECFKELNVDEWGDIKNKDALSKFSCAIEDKGNVSYGCGFATKITPLQRINQYDDITSIYIKLNNSNEEIQLYTEWEATSYYADNNIYQKSEMNSYKELKLNIGSCFKEFNISEVFKFSDNTIFYDTEGNEYKIYEDDETGTKYIFNETISDELLKKTFVLTK